MIGDIFKYPISTAGSFILTLPKGSKVIHVGLQYGDPVMWVQQPRPAREPRRQHVHFGVNLTGPETVDLNTTHVGTFVLDDVYFVGHVYELYREEI